MGLQHGPDRVILGILLSLDDCEDLLNVVNGSKRFNTVFRAHYKAIAASVLKRQLDPESLRILNFVRGTPRLPQGDVALGPHREALRRHLFSFFETAESGQYAGPTVTSILDFKALAKFLDCLDFIMDMYRAHAMETLGWWPTKNSRTSPDNNAPREHKYLDPMSSFEPIYFRAMSPSERTRLQRAFLHHELYCACFPMIPIGNQRLSIVDLKFQREHFITKLPAWEVEELLCVHDFLVALLKHPLRQLETEVVRKVKNSPGVVPVKMFAFPDGPPPPLFRPRIGDNLWMFSAAARRHSRRFLGHVASLGLVKVITTRYGSFDDAKELIKTNTVVMRDFIIETIHAESEVSAAPAENYTFNSGSPESTDAPNLAFVQVQSFGNGGTILCAKDGSGRDYQRRQWGYVFWDQDLLRNEVFSERTRCLHDNPIGSSGPPRTGYDTVMGWSVEERLKDLAQTLGNWDVNIRNQYGSTYPMNVWDLLSNQEPAVVEAMGANDDVDEMDQDTEESGSDGSDLEGSDEGSDDEDQGDEDQVMEEDLYNVSAQEDL